MKKIGILAGVILTSVLIGCASTKKADTNDISTDTEKTAKISNENNVQTQARETVVVDWQDRTIGAKVNPDWLFALVRGNGNNYVNTFGLSESFANHKWFCSSAQNPNKTNAQTIAETEAVYALAAEMANTINAEVGEDLSNGQKDIVRRICSNVNNVTLNGVGNRGSYWQLEKTTDEYGNVTSNYNYYTFYSCPVNKYNELLQIYLVELLQSKDLDEAAVNAIAKNAQKILDDQEYEREQLEVKKEREYKMQLEYEETKRLEMINDTQKYISDNQTKQVQSANEATATISNGDNAASVANRSTMNPALAAIVKARGF